MYIKFIGSCDANPDDGRCHSGIILHTDNQNYLFDCGDGVASKIWNDKQIDLNSINNIFITHMDPDHVGGIFCLVGLFQQYIKDLDEAKRNKNIINFFIPSEEAIAYIEGLIPIMRQDKDNIYRKRFNSYKGTGEIYKDDILSIEAFPTFHAKESHGFVIRVHGQKIVYTGDIKNPSVIADYTNNSDLVIIECAHFEPGEIASALTGRNIKNVIVTHINKVKYDDPLNMMDELKPLASQTNIYIARDGMIFKFR